MQGRLISPQHGTWPYDMHRSGTYCVLATWAGPFLLSVSDDSNRPRRGATDEKPTSCGIGALLRGHRVRSSLHTCGERPTGSLVGLASDEMGSIAKCRLTCDGWGELDAQRGFSERSNWISSIHFNITVEDIKQPQSRRALRTLLPFSNATPGKSICSAQRGACH